MDYIEVARTNYFRVKDMAAFTEALRWLGGSVTVIERGAPPDEDVCLIFEDGVPTERIPEDVDPDDEHAWDEPDWIEFEEWLVPHLAEGQVAVIMASGHEGRRYVTGYATAVNWRGESVHLNISKIYELAEPLKQHAADEITFAEY